ncbi:transposase [Dapis sp. BLCC M126]|uniref:transposase n=1 Tax=Dapis sp. BLCC M126 TaxID=3400189 RepID=UPI003CE74642
MEKIYKCITFLTTSTGKEKTRWTTLIIIDSQAVKNTCNAGVESKGFCFYKITKGINRHLAVDSLGFHFFVHFTKASVSDDMKLIEILSHKIDYFESKPVNISISHKPSKAEKKQERKTGFVPVKARWVIERTNSWMERCKSLTKNFEKTLDNATAKINLCLIRLMFKRLAFA